MNSPDQAHPVSKLSGGNTVPFPKQRAPRPGRLEQLVKLEGDIRQLQSRTSLGLHAVNETCELIGCEQAFLFRCDKHGKPRLELASSVAKIEPHAALARQLTASVAQISEKARPQQLSILTESYPCVHGFWVPMLDGKLRPFGGLLFARSLPWTETETAIAVRLSQAYGVSMRAMTSPSLLYRFSIPRWVVVAATLGAAALALIPTPIRALAPVEVVAELPVVVTAPTDGVIAEVLISPNRPVKQGDLLFRLDQTTALADAQVAAQRLSVAQAKVEALRSGAFADPKAGHDLPVAEKERDLAQVESDIAQRKLQRTEVRATESGLAIFSSRTELVGKPVRVGEKIMEIADPAHVAYRAEIAVHDAIPISDGAEMQVFLDADPLVAHSASLISVSFHAQPEADGKMSYRVMAKSRDEKTPPQLGLRGTAQITGQTSTLGMVLLRRPIAAIRQYLGR